MDTHIAQLTRFAPLVLVMACGSSSPSPSPNNNASTGQADAGGGPAAAGTADVTVGMNGGLTFSPQNVVIHPGDTVRWTWAASGHSVTSGTAGAADGRFCSPNDASCSAGTLSPAGTVYTHTFTTAGTFPYFCAVHFSMGMTGTVTVQ